MGNNLVTLDACGNPCGQSRIKDGESNFEEKSRWNASLNNENFNKFKNALDDYHMKVLEDKLASIEWLEAPEMQKPKRYSQKNSVGNNTKDYTGVTEYSPNEKTKSPISGLSAFEQTPPKKRNLDRQRVNKYINDIKIEASPRIPKKDEFKSIQFKGKVIGFALQKGEMSSVSEDSAATPNQLYSGAENCIILNKTPKNIKQNYRLVHGKKNKNYQERKAKSRSRAEKGQNIKLVSQKNWQNLSNSNSTNRLACSTGRVLNIGAALESFGSIEGFEVGPPQSQKDDKSFNLLDEHYTQNIKKIRINNEIPQSERGPRIQEVRKSKNSRNRRY